MEELAREQDQEQETELVRLFRTCSDIDKTALLLLARAASTRRRWPANVIPLRERRRYLRR